MHYRHTGALVSQELCMQFLSLIFGSSAEYV